MLTSPVELEQLLTHTYQLLARVGDRWMEIEVPEEVEPLTEDIADRMQILFTRVSELMTALGLGFEVPQASTAPTISPGKFPPVAQTIMSRIFFLPQTEWPRDLITAVSKAYGVRGSLEKLKNRQITVRTGDHTWSVFTFWYDLQPNGPGLIRANLYDGFHRLLELLAVDDEEIAHRARLANPAAFLFQRINFRQNYREIFNKLKQWGVIPIDAKLEE